MAETTYNITLTANHQALTAEYLPLAAESVQYLTAKVVCETEDWTGREIKAMFGQGCTVYEVPVTGGEITAKQQLNLTAGDWRVWLVGNSARDGEVIPRITTNVAHISVAPTGGTEGNPFPATPPTVEEQLRADMGNLADLTTEDKSSLVAAINEVRQTGGVGVQHDWNQNDSTQPDYIKNRPFYTGDPVETVLVEESTATFAENNGLYVARFPSTFEATVGETYKVSWDGTAYECACVNFSGSTAIGNLSIAGAGSDTGEPFVMNIFNGKGIVIGTADTSASHTFSICVFAPEVVKIDPKYIRDMYYTGDPVETVLLEETTAEFTEKNGVYSYKLGNPLSLEVGQTYQVSWDGTVYECVGTDFRGNTILGNLSIQNAGEDTGEPFLYGFGSFDTKDTSASHTISISGIVAPITKIDEKYLPDSIISDISTAQSTANAAQSTADAAQSTANAAQSTANAAQSTADAAQSTANAAQSTADAAKTTADGCVKINNTDSFSINLSGKSSFSAGDYGEKSYYCFHRESVTDKPIVLSIGTTGGSALEISVTPSTSPTVKITPPVYLNKQADIEIGGNPYLPRPQITGLGGITMYSSTSGSTKKFKITVDDSGTITATEA